MPVVDNCLAGYNSSIFAYGQTGSGKTHTVLGQLNSAELVRAGPGAAPAASAHQAACAQPGLPAAWRLQGPALPTANALPQTCPGRRSRTHLPALP
jgi:hypothetical protein